MSTEYQRISEELRQQIAGGVWQAGDQLPGEHELMDTFGVSRNTIRRALDALSKSNLVRRQQGKGTFVSEQGVSHVLGDLRSFTTIMQDLGKLPGIAKVTVHIDPSPPEEAHTFLRGSTIWLAQRVRTADRRPFSLMQSWLPDAIGSRFTAGELTENQSLYAVFANKLNLIPSEATEVIRAEAARELEAALLKVSVGTPLLSIYRWTQDHTGLPIEYVRSTSPGDRHQYVIKLHQ